MSNVIHCIKLNPAEVNNVLNVYYEKEKGCKVSIGERLSIIKHKPDIKYLLTEHLEGGINRFSVLTHEDIKKAIDNYAYENGFELLDMKYMGGIHNVGYFTDRSLYYEGIELSVKTREKEKVLRKEE